MAKGKCARFLDLSITQKPVIWDCSWIKSIVARIFGKEKKWWVDGNGGGSEKWDHF
jgi:hypothetical protein